MKQQCKLYNNELLNNGVNAAWFVKSCQVFSCPRRNVTLLVDEKMQSRRKEARVLAHPIVADVVPLVAQHCHVIAKQLHPPLDQKHSVIL